MATTSPGVTPSRRSPCARDTTSSTNCSPVLRRFPAIVTGECRRKVSNRLRHWQIWAMCVNVKNRAFHQFDLLITLFICSDTKKDNSFVMCLWLPSYVSLFYWRCQNFNLLTHLSCIHVSLTSVSRIKILRIFLLEIRN